MKARMILAALRNVCVALVAVTFVASCGGGSDSTTQPDTAAAPDTGTVGLWFTDLPSDDYTSIRLTVSSAVLIGGDNSQEVLFEGERHIDLLDLTNYSEPVVFGEVQAGNYTKIRLMLDAIELVPADGSPAFFINRLPANGKIDLLQPDGFDVLPGRTVMVEIDVDANKAIKITNAGNSGRVNFRPVVKVNVYDSGMPHKLARLEGAVSGEPNSGAGTFVLCNIDAPDYCVDVATNSMTSIFDDQGLGTDFSGLSDGAMAVVIGEYSSDPIVLNAIVVQVGGNSQQVSGQVVSEPANSQFLVLTIGGMDVLVELQPGTKYYDASGPIGADAIVLGTDVEVEGVMPPKADPEDPDMIRAALVFLEAPDAELLSGTIAEGTLDATARTFDLTKEDDSSVCVRVADEADILLVDTENSEVTPGTFDDLADNQVVDLFGATAEDSCFDADEVIVDVDASATP